MGARLLLRLTAHCNSGCAHCTVADLAHLPDRNTDKAWAEIMAGRKRGCDELVFMRGEVTLRKDLLKLIRAARGIGYRQVQLQTNGRMFAYEAYLPAALKAGLTHVEMAFFAHDAGLHDLIDGTEGAHAQAVAGLGHLVAARCPLLVTVPVLARNYLVLPEIMRFLHAQGVQRVQLGFPRPVRLGSRWNTEPLVRLSEASPFIRAGLAQARALGMQAETEAVPLCHLDPADRPAHGGELVEDFQRHQVSDLHRFEADGARQRQQARPKPAPCQACPLLRRCPGTWAAYQSLYGTWELSPPAEPASPTSGHA